MYTEQIKRRKSNAYFEMKTITGTSQKDKIIQKLGSSIYASMEKLQSLKAQIMAANMKDLPPLMKEFQKEHASFMEKQKSLMEIQESSQKIDRLKDKVREFLEVFSPEDIEKKFQSMQDEIIRQSEMQDQQMQLQQSKYAGDSMRTKLLQEEEAELKNIQAMMIQVKNIAMETSQLVLSVGAKIKISHDTIINARKNMAKGKEDLVKTNEYHQDTNRIKLFLGALLCVIILVIILVMIAARKTS